MIHSRLAAVTVAAALLAACGSHNGAAVPGDAENNQPFAGIAEDEVVHFTGTEPFWGGEIAGGQLTWSTPENTADNGSGQYAPVTRFAGRGGVSFSGELDGQAIDLMVTPVPASSPCSDGMSDRSYPFAVTVTLGEQQLQGCGWSDRQGYTGGE